MTLLSHFQIVMHTAIRYSVVKVQCEWVLYFGDAIVFLFFKQIRLRRCSDYGHQESQVVILKNCCVCWMWCFDVHPINQINVPMPVEQVEVIYIVQTLAKIENIVVAHSTTQD